MNVHQIPYAPGGKGFMGHNGEFRKDRFGVLGRLARTEGALFRLRVPVPGVNALIANGPDVIQEILVEKGKSFDKSDMLRFALYPLVGEGLFTANGELWRRQRKLMAPLFHPRALEGYARDMVDGALRTVADWKDGEERRLLNETTRLTMSVAGKTLFDADTFTEADAIGHALTVALDWSGWMAGRPFAIAHMIARRTLLRRGYPGLADRFRGPLVQIGKRGRELSAAIRLLDERVQRMIDERRAGGRRHDLLSSLLEARDDDGAAPEPASAATDLGDPEARRSRATWSPGAKRAGGTMDDRQVRDEVLTLFVAGHETTATGLAWTIALLGRHPEWLARVEAEVDAVGDAPTLADLPRLPLCLRVFREALRIYPPVYAFGRDTNEHVEIGGFELPPRTNVLVSPLALHHSAAVWPEPQRFDPDRFLPENEAARPRYAYLPFGAGQRICIGNHFAYMEAQLALAVILRRFRLTPLADDVPAASATLRPKLGVPVSIKRR